MRAIDSEPLDPFQLSLPTQMSLELAAGELDFDDFVSFEFGPPGKLTVNAGHRRSSFAVPAERFQFSSEADFVDFVVRTFNAIPYFDNGGKFLGFFLDVEIIGSPLMSNHTGTMVVEVEDPISTYLGGPDGYISVAGITKCIAPEHCAATGNTRESIVEGHASFLSSSIAAEPSPGEELPPFDIVGTRSIRRDSTLGGVVAIVQTKLSEKSVRPYHTTWCGPRQVVTFNGISHYAPTTCSTEVLFSNELQLGVTTFTMAFQDECRRETHYLTDPEASIPGGFYTTISWAVNAELVRREFYFPQSGGYLSIDGMQADHLGGFGKYPDFIKLVESRGWCIGTGCIVGDPCE